MQERGGRRSKVNRHQCVKWQWPTQDRANLQERCIEYPLENEIDQNERIKHRWRM